MSSTDFSFQNMVFWNLFELSEADITKKSISPTSYQIKIIQYSRTLPPQVQTSWNRAHAHLLIKNFPKTPRTQSEASRVCGSHNYKTKQNKLPSFIDRYPLEITKSQFLKMALGPVIQKVITLELYL
jgi:hypothetical protein